MQIKFTAITYIHTYKNAQQLIICHTDYKLTGDPLKLHRS